MLKCSNAQCQISNCQVPKCSMLNAQCSNAQISNAQCRMRNLKVNDQSRMPSPTHSAQVVVASQRHDMTDIPFCLCLHLCTLCISFVHFHLLKHTYTRACIPYQVAVPTKSKLVSEPGRFVLQAHFTPRTVCTTPWGSVCSCRGVQRPATAPRLPCACR